jgi:hypothetical protein
MQGIVVEHAPEYARIYLSKPPPPNYERIKCHDCVEEGRQILQVKQALRSANYTYMDL